MSDLDLVIKSAAFKARDRITRSPTRKAQRSFRRFLRYVWDNSRFYRQYYLDFGIRREDLKHIDIWELPFTDKDLLMDNLDDVFTDRRLRRSEIEAWLAHNPNPNARYLDDYHVMHTSGSSGNPGIFVFDDAALETLGAEILAKVGSTRKQLRRTRAAYLGVTHGRTAGHVLSRNVPKYLYDVRSYSVMDPYDKIVAELNAFQPDQITGYAAALARLATHAHRGELKISPRSIFTTGEMMSEPMRDQVVKAWGVQPVDLYGTAECFLGVKTRPEGSFRILDNITLVEALADDEQAVGERQPVAITNLYNRITPIIRYRTDDNVIPGRKIYHDCVETIGGLAGRVVDALPIVTNEGRADEVHSSALVELFVEGVERFQFLSHGRDSATIQYVANNGLDRKVEQEFLRLLATKGAERAVRVRVQRVSEISPAPSGKTPVVKLDVAFVNGLMAS